MRGPTLPAPKSKRIDLLLLGCALVAYVVLGSVMSERMMVFSEELFVVPTPGARVAAAELGPDGAVRFSPSCADPDAPRLLLSTGRPTLSLCAGGRALPVMAAPQFAGLFTWPLEALRAFHRDDPFVLRKLLLPIGLAAILLGFRLISRLADPRLAALAAVGMAVSPCFVLMESIIQPFETLPWVFVLCALLAFSNCRALAPGGEGAPPTGRLVAGAFFTGLAILANVKAVFLIAPLGLLALRLGVRARAVRPAQWLLMILAVLVALSPMFLPAALDPSLSFARGRGPDWKERVLVNLGHPRKALEAIRDLLLLGSNFGFYFVRDRLNLVSMGACGAVFVFVFVDAARTIVRRRGCVVTAACGVIALAYVGVVTLFYTDFPANYTPLHAVYGIALGCAATRIARAVRSRGPAIVAAALVFAPFAWNTFQTIHAVSEMAFVTNSRAERDLTRHLLQEPDAVPVTVSLLAAGVVDRLSDGRLRTVQAHELMNACEEPRHEHAMADCYRARWRALLDPATRGRVVKAVLPASLSLVRRREEITRLQRAGLEQAARELGLDVRLEQGFSTPGGAPAAELLRIAPRAP